MAAVTDLSHFYSCTVRSHALCMVPVSTVQYHTRDRNTVDRNAVDRNTFIERTSLETTCLQSLMKTGSGSKGLRASSLCSQSPKYTEIQPQLEKQM